ncbi:MAG: DUF547 domain-containing protein [Kaiparowitsia implicata GSE-PSE-MK54-09C]|jgi:hypothetical protein|nr:DUF547 domain-containing protein [Kaiparowitsia implicata GSE-PSE-MK54-09C]
MLTLKSALICTSLLAALAGCATLPSPSSTAGNTPEAATDTDSVAQATPFDYSDYADLLSTFVDDEGMVNYPGLQVNAERLKAFNATLGEVSSSQFDAWSEAEQIAFLTNAYNAFTLESIIDQQPIKSSIRDIPGVWRGRQFRVAGQLKTLDNIEHQTLRPNYNEPRIHAALNCSAISCPVLRTEPYTGEQLDAQLEEQVQRWVDSPEGLQIDREANRVMISQIFDWFGEDWIADYAVAEGEGFAGNEKQRATLNFISQYATEGDRTYLQQGDYSVSYINYNWDLNIQPR